MSSIVSSSLSPALRQVLVHSACAKAAYASAAAALEKEGRHVIAHAFAFTARQEGEHAAILQDMLCQPELPSVRIPAAAGGPAGLLRRALRHENICADILYPAAWKEAEERGQPRLADALRCMARTEAQHARRFRQYLMAMGDGSLTRSEDGTGWLCLCCGGLHYGCTAPQCCEGCGRGAGHFIRSDFYPFAVGN